jgi:hypothetical protein
MNLCWYQFVMKNKSSTILSVNGYGENYYWNVSLKQNKDSNLSTK